jgi:hypothetical protein
VAAAGHAHGTAAAGALTCCEASSPSPSIAAIGGSSCFGRHPERPFISRAPVVEGPTNHPAPPSPCRPA